MTEQTFDETKNVQEVEDPELHRLLVPNAEDLPLIPPSATESNFVSYFAPGFYSIFIYLCIYFIRSLNLILAHFSLKFESPFGFQIL